MFESLFMITPVRAIRGWMERISGDRGDRIAPETPL
jgi:hypothetical protein